MQTTTPYRNGELWRVFDEAADQVISRRDFEKWLSALGVYTNKPELQDNGTIKEIARVCEEDIGCQTGNEYMMLEEQDMVAAGIRTMTARVIVRAAQQQQQQEKPTSIKSPTLSEKSSAETVAEMVAESMVESARQSAQGVKEATERKALKKLSVSEGARLPSAKAFEVTPR